MGVGEGALDSHRNTGHSAEALPAMRVLSLDVVYGIIDHFVAGGVG